MAKKLKPIVREKLLKLKVEMNNTVHASLKKKGMTEEEINDHLQMINENLDQLDKD